MKSFLKHNSQSLGKNNRWIGGKYDWKNERWVWAETGKPISLKTFARNVPDKRFLQWTCIVVAPNRMNKWALKSCLQPNQFICQKKPKRPIRPKTFDIRICRRNVTQLTDSQKIKCLKLVGGYAGKMFPNVPAPIIQTPKPTMKNLKEYMCPSNMLIIKNRCYHFSHDKLNWNDAYWACRDNKTYLATIQNRFQDKMLKEFLNSGLAGKHERWLGGLYDWKQKRWLWANSGIPLKYQGFPFKNYTGSQFEWRSITIDPNIGNMWSSRLRTELKHYICQKRAKTIAKLGDYNTALY
ncbi:hypothetical protein HHI36_005875 [Cryptolaemus montrouzieri]|uniref:C-type lectin domain-containing protein n=1 Tax=Cryptolaemus montrouzieri TaxID=559131 RepID=A0ABD2NWD9_9CUCU